MKILLLCWRDSTHPQGGGSERYLEHVAEYLAACGHEVVYRTAGHTDAPARTRRGRMLYSRAGGKFTVYPRALAALLLGRLGLGVLRGVDVVVDTQNGVPFFAELVAGRPTVLLTHHCHREQWPVAGRLLGRFGWFLESKIAPRVYRGRPYVTVSEASRSELVELGVAEEDISIIANGVDPVPDPLPRLTDDGALHLVTLSRLVPHKRLEHAIDTVAALVGKHPNVVLDVISSGWWEDNLRSYAIQRGVADRVIFHGQVTEDYKHALLARAAVHLMPSRKEGWGLAVMEAAQHAVPTVGYRAAGGLRDSIRDGETGVLVESLPGFIAAVGDLLDDPAHRGELGEEALAWSGKFSWQDTGAHFEELLTRLGEQSAHG
ncbi:MAG TPA: glycosyltransferase family 4 protein [Corynebacterium sp.]|nr:glycosyltransferase family 4 protein [Corynebacterium sp.]